MFVKEKRIPSKTTWKCAKSWPLKAQPDRYCPQTLFDIMNTIILFIQHTAMFRPYISSYLPICFVFASTHILKISAAEMHAFTWI